MWNLCIHGVCVCALLKHADDSDDSECVCVCVRATAAFLFPKQITLTCDLNKLVSQFEE